MPPTLDDVANAFSSVTQQAESIAAKVVDGLTPDDVKNAAQAVAGATYTQESPSAGPPSAGPPSAGGGGSVIGDLGGLIGSIPDTITKGRAAVDNFQRQADAISAKANATLDNVNAAAVAARQTAMAGQEALRNANATVSKVGEAAQGTEVAGAVSVGLGLLGLLWLLSRKN